MSLPKVSVIIVNYNGKALLEKCLESLSKVNYENFEIIVVDNNSTDGSIELVTKNYPSIILLKLNSNKGFAEPNNIGAKIANGKYLLFLNNDTIVTPNFISEMVQVIENDKKIAICQSLLLKPDESVDSSGDFIDHLGIVYHVGGQTIKSKKPEIAFHGFKNQLAMKITNFEPPIAIRNTLLFFIRYGFRELKIWCDYKIKGTTALTATDYENKIAEKPSFKIITKSILWVLSNPKYLLKKQRQIRFSRKVSTKALMKMNIITNKIQ